MNKCISFFQCVIDAEEQMLVFGTNVREQVHFVQKLLNKRYVFNPWSVFYSVVALKAAWKGGFLGSTWTEEIISASRIQTGSWFHTTGAA